METNNTRQYFVNLSVGVAMTPSGVAVGGAGKWSDTVRAAMSKCGLKINPRTGEYFSPEVSYNEVLTALRNA